MNAWTGRSGMDLKEKKGKVISKSYRIFWPLAGMLAISLVLWACHNGEKHSGRYPDCSSSDIEWNDSCLLGKPLSEAIEQLHADTSQYSTVGDSAGVVNGVAIVNDTIEIELYVHTADATAVDQSVDQKLYALIRDSAVIGLSWRKPGKEKERVLY